MMIPVVFGLVLDAAIFGVILVLVAGEFPGWATVAGCVIAVGFVSNVVAAFLPWPASLLGLVAGAVVGAWLLGWVTEIGFRRALKPAGIYMAIRVALTVALLPLMR